MATKDTKPQEPTSDEDGKYWSGEVTAHEKWHSPEGLFNEDAETIAATIVENSESKRQAISRVTFYENRAGSNLDDDERDKLEKAKEIIRGHYDNPDSEE